MHLPDINCQAGSRGSEIPDRKQENQPGGEPGSAAVGFKEAENRLVAGV